jgi:hypothetical protein
MAAENGEFPLVAWLLARVTEFALIGWLGLLALVVAIRILRGDIPLTGLLANTGTGVDPERIQSLLVIVFVFAGYLMEFASGSNGARALPEVPSSLFIVLAGSNGVYLSGKLTRNVT